MRSALLTVRGALPWTTINNNLLNQKVFYMYNKSRVLKNYQYHLDEMQAILDEAGEDLSEDQQAEFDEHKAKAEDAKKQLIDNGDFTLGRQVPPENPQTGNLMDGPNFRDDFQTSPVRAVKPRDCRQVFSSDKTARRFANYIGAIVGNPQCIGYCSSNSLNIYSSMTEGTNTAGGYLVPQEFSNDLINLRDEYGIFRRYAAIDSMLSDEKKTPRVTGHPTVYYVGEASQITSSAITLDQVSLIAKKPAVLIVFSRELRDDSMIRLGNLLADEIAWTIAQAEDQAGFVGDGTSTYGGIIGITNKLSTLNGVEDGGGLVLGTGNAYSELTLTDFANVIARTPAYAKRGGNAKWYCSSYFYAAVMLKLMINAGGNTAESLQMGASQGPKFLGHEVIFTETMPTAEANSQICCLFGNLAQAATVGDRLGITIENSSEATIGDTNLFETDQYAIRGLERYDINVHDVGSATEAGPIVGLITQAS